MKQLSSKHDQASFAGLSFLWLELTNRCNLECVHCYSDSSPRSGDKDTLTRTDYLRTIDDGASAAGYTYIEVYSNLIRLPSELVQTAQRTKARFATSVYSSDPAVHDAVTC